MARSNAEIAADLRVACTWVSGTQAQVLATLAAELDGSTPPELTPNQQHEQQLAAKAAADAQAAQAAAQAQAQAAQAAQANASVQADANL